MVLWNDQGDSSWNGETSHLPLKEDVLLVSLPELPWTCLCCCLGQCSRNHHVGISLETGFGHPRKLQKVKVSPWGLLPSLLLWCAKGWRSRFKGRKQAWPPVLFSRMILSHIVWLQKILKLLRKLSFTHFLPTVSLLISALISDFLLLIFCNGENVFSFLN